MTRRLSRNADLFGVTMAEYTASQRTYHLRRLRLKEVVLGQPKTNRYFPTPQKGSRRQAFLEGFAFAVPVLRGFSAFGGSFSV